jgi:hypothetical protein
MAHQAPRHTLCLLLSLPSLLLVAGDRPKEHVLVELVILMDGERENGGGRQAGHRLVRQVEAPVRSLLLLELAFQEPRVKEALGLGALVPQRALPVELLPHL